MEWREEEDPCRSKVGLNNLDERTREGQVASLSKLLHSSEGPSQLVCIVTVLIPYHPGTFILLGHHTRAVHERFGGCSIQHFTITAEILHAHWLDFIVNKRTDT